MAKRKRNIGFGRHSDIERKTEQSQEIASLDKGFSINWFFIRDLIDILKKAKQKRIERNINKNLKKG